MAISLHQVAMKTQGVVLIHNNPECRDWQETFYANPEVRPDGIVFSRVHFKYPRVLPEGSRLYENTQRYGIVERCTAEQDGCFRINAVMLTPSRPSHVSPPAAGDFCMP